MIYLVTLRRHRVNATSETRTMRIDDIGWKAVGAELRDGWMISAIEEESA